MPLHLLDQRLLLLTIDDAEDLLIELSEFQMLAHPIIWTVEREIVVQQKGWKIQRIERGLQRDIPRLLLGRMIHTAHTGLPRRRPPRVSGGPP